MLSVPASELMRLRLPDPRHADLLLFGFNHPYIEKRIFLILGVLKQLAVISVGLTDYV